MNEEVNAVMGGNVYKLPSEYLAEGRLEGRAEGMKEGAKNALFQLLSRGKSTLEDVAEGLNLSAEETGKHMTGGPQLYSIINSFNQP